MCEPRPGAAYASSCNTRQRFNREQERFVPYPDASPDSNDESTDWPF